MTVPQQANLGQQVTGLQMAAIAVGTQVDATRVDAFTSDVFDASRAETATFTAPVDGKRSFVLILQVPSASTTAPGAFVAALKFNDGRGDTTLLPPGTDDIDLATVELVQGARPADDALVVGDANNPLAQIDTDGDGSPDLSDDDDDGDGAVDATDPDVGGDGVDDAKQVLAALIDSDGDGIPDVLDP